MEENESKDKPVDTANDEKKDEPIEELVAPPDGNNSPEEEKAPHIHPLLPGGKRFEQVYAKGKQAERDAQELRDRLIAAETKLEMLTSKSAKPEAEIEYSWSQLEEFISQGKITRADAEAHRESIIERRIANKAKNAYAEEVTKNTRIDGLTQHLSAYIAAAPAVMVEGSIERERLEEEFNWLASVQGLDTSKIDDAQRKILQVTALRNVFGPLDSLTKRTAAPARSSTHEGLPGGSPRQATTNPKQEALNNLTKAQVEHYNKMMRTGRYPGGWKDVAEELLYQPPARGSR